MILRNSRLTTTIGILAGALGLILLAGTLGHGPAGGRAALGIAGVVLIVIATRASGAGLNLQPDVMLVRDVWGTARYPRSEVAGLALQNMWRGRRRRVILVLVDGITVPVAWTTYTLSRTPTATEAAHAATGFGETQQRVAAILEGHGRLGGMAELPIATVEPGLTPATVTPLEESPATRWLGWETAFVITAFALPGVVDAVVLLARHIGGVGDLNDFATPLPHHLGASLVLLILEYSTTALVVPIALLLLARSGCPPAGLGLSRNGLLPDVGRGAGLLIGVWVLNIIILLPLHTVLNNKHLTNTSSDSHVPAYYVVYAIMLAATTAINEEVLVNGYFLTRLSQLGYGRWAALAISLSVRTSYHVYYGVGLIATVPFGYLATRSFQKHGRLGRPIVAHFLNDAILLVVAVLTS